jgi:hypothetical protein
MITPSMWYRGRMLSSTKGRMKKTATMRPPNRPREIRRAAQRESRIALNDVIF